MRLILLLVLLTPAQVIAQSLHGRVLDHATMEGIPLATLLVVGTDQGTAADIDGHFHLDLPEGARELRVSAVGYTSERFLITDAMRSGEPFHLHLHPNVIQHQEVVVSADGGAVRDPAASPHVQRATEDLMDRVPGADFIQRANFAWEPVIRGMSGGQIGLVIDGIKVIGACIDEMDPTSAYVEVENLERLDLTKGGFDLSSGSQIGGAINLVTQKPSLSDPFSLSSEAGFESASGLRRGRVVASASEGDVGVRFSYSYKRAADFRPGGGAADVAGSGYEKNNYKADVAWQPHHAHRLEASFLGDNAWGVGYPVLLMDATLAKARIYSLTHTLTPHSGGAPHHVETKVYHNTVDHWMDDFGRDVLERQVMRGMNMPMYGLTRTSGLISTADIRLDGGNRVGVTLDAYRTKSFGDMWMFSVFEGIQDMYLLNLGDVVVNHAALAVNGTYHLSERLSLRADARMDVSPRDVKREESRSILEGRWDTDDLSRTYVLGNLSTTLEYAFSPATRVRFGMANVSRLPTHIENYGHYVYNYVDGYFYTGNPDLKPERSRQAEIGIDHWGQRAGLRASVFANHVRNYIIGEGDTGLTEGSSTYRFRVYRNADAALLMGGEVSAVAELGKGISIAGAGSYTWGQNLEFDEPLYLMPPLSGMLSLRADRGRRWAELEARMAMPQNRVSRQVAREDGTDGYFILNVRGSLPVPGGAELKVGVENLLDTFYQEHLSFGNLPNEGRNLYVALAWAY
ncbi:MAG: TonB-dependent receptor [Rhodothermales bacterium]|nr:TonB-dependent receptor [Rhodothermales bacterium]MBO6780338.1 TonB-dependent receptor [Rhodothermales bacterium]